MQENPYKPLDIPEEDDVVVTEIDDILNLKLLASRQRQVLYSLLCSLLIIMSSFGFNAIMLQTPPSSSSMAVVGIVAVVFAILSLACTVWRLVATFLLAKIMYSTTSAVFWTLGILIPLLGFILLVLLNQRAITRLQQNGLKVGFMGVNPRQLESLDVQNA